MSNSITLDLGRVEADTTEKTTGLFDAVVAARQRQGKAYVKAYLARQSDSTLASLGFNPEQIAAIRKTGEIPASFWR
jgi:hypothetical protein